MLLNFKKKKLYIFFVLPIIFVYFFIKQCIATYLFYPVNDKTYVRTGEQLIRISKQ